MESTCPVCGTQRADGAGFCGRCGRQFDSGAPAAAPPPLPQQAQPASGDAPPPVAPRRRYSIGQKLFLGVFLIGFLAVSFVVIEAKNRARHPWHYHH